MAAVLRSRGWGAGNGGGRSAVAAGPPRCGCAAPAGCAGVPDGATVGRARVCRVRVLASAEPWAPLRNPGWATRVTGPMTTEDRRRLAVFLEESSTELLSRRVRFVPGPTYDGDPRLGAALPSSGGGGVLEPGSRGLSSATRHALGRHRRRLWSDGFAATRSASWAALALSDPINVRRAVARMMAERAVLGRGSVGGGASVVALGAGCVGRLPAGGGRGLPGHCCGARFDGPSWRLLRSPSARTRRTS